MENNDLTILFDSYLVDISDEFKVYDLPCSFSARYKKKKKQIIQMFKNDSQNNLDYKSGINNIAKHHRVKLSIAVILAALLLCGAGIVSRYVFNDEYSSVSEAAKELGVSLIEYHNLKWQEAYLSESGNVKIIQAGVIPANELSDNKIIIESNKLNEFEDIEVQSITAILFEPAATKNERKEAYEMLLSPNIPVVETFYCDALNRELKFFCGSYETETATAHAAVAVLEEENQIYLISLKNIDGVSESILLEKIKEICEEMRWTNYSN